VHDPVLVTGASGFIGRHLVRQLLDAGHSVRVLVRDHEPLQPVIDRVDLVTGDLTEPHTIERAVRGARSILHLAACARAWVVDRSEYTRVNVGAVDSLLRAARRHDVERLVHVSTVLTLPPYREAAVNHGAQRPTPYERTKREGEELVRRYVEEGRHAVIVHPTRVYGPGPLTDANAVTKSIVLYARGRLRVRLNDGDAQANYVHAEDVARGIMLAGQRGQAGARYVLGGENATFAGLLARVDAIAGIHRWVVPLPPALAVGVGAAAEWWGRVTGTAPFTARWVRSLLEDRRAAVASAMHDLGYAPRSLDQGLQETIAWLRSQRMLPV
jgi:farnesol dehydrogenase